MSIQTDIQQQVRAGNLRQAIASGLQYAQSRQLEAATDWSMLQARWQKLSRDERIGILSYSEATQERNRITMSILDMAGELEQAASKPSSPLPISPSPEPAATEPRILFLAANPTDTTRLKLQDEFVWISRHLQDSRFRLLSEWAVTTSSLQQAILKHRPQIIHFSGHGAAGAPDPTQKTAGSRALHTRDTAADELGGIFLEDPSGRGGSKYVKGQALEELFSIIIQVFPLEVVVLNACYSEPQAKAINRHVPYVIGMSREIQDKSAIQFSSSFYMALSQTEQVKLAYQLACNQINIAGGSDASVPVLHERTG